MTHTPDEIAAMIERLDTIYKDDHERGCPMRCSACECGFEAAVDATARDAAAMLREVAAERDAMAVAEQNAFNQRNMVLDELKRAEAERDRLAAMVEKMRGWVRHDDDCGVNALLMPRPPLTKQCTCGLSEVLKESQDESR